MFLQLFELTDRLKDLETDLVKFRDGINLLEETWESRYILLTSVRNICWNDVHTVTVEVSSSRSPGDIHGIEYTLQNIDGFWTVVKEGVAWMS